MRTLGRTAALAALLSLLIAPTASAGWSQVAGPLNTVPAPDAAAPATAMVDGVLHAVWTEGPQSTEEVRVARLGADGAWELVGGPLDRSADSWAIEPAIAAVDGTLYVSWSERAPRENVFTVHVSRLTGDGLEPLPDPGGSDFDTRDSSLTGVGGELFVAFTEPDSDNREVRVKRLVDGEWVAAGGLVNRSSRAAAAATLPDSLVSPPAERDGADPDLAEIDGVPHVAWAEAGGIHVARLDGAEWVDLGSPAGTNAGLPDLDALGGTPFAAWREADGEVRAARFAGGSWQEPTGAPVNSAFSGRPPSIAAIGADVWLAWEEDGQLHAARLDAVGTQWSEPAGGLGAGRDPALVDVGGTPYLGWVGGFAVNQRSVNVSRLEPELLSVTASPEIEGATFSATVRTYGLSYPVAFAYGIEGGGLPLRTEWTDVAGNEVEVTATVSGLERRTTYEVRPVARAGHPAPEVEGPLTTFETPKLKATPGKNRRP